jgi:hypothetical protein
MTIITLKFEGIDKVRTQLARLSGAQARDAYAKAINDTAFQVRRTMQSEFAAKFDRVTPYILRSVQFKGATADALSATVQPTYFGGKGVDPQQILKAQEAGGSRRDKRSEVALRRVGILPTGYQTVIPRAAFPGSADVYGNIKGSFITQLISYFQAFGEQGFRANATDRRKKSIGKGTAKTEGRRYFVSYGKLRGNRSSHLAPGIWAASGTHGSNVRPVLMFVKAGRYKPLIAMEGIAKKAGAEEYLARRLRFRIRQAAEALG